jgi:hypothetical protein
MRLELTVNNLYWSRSAGISRWWSRMPRSVVQKATRRAELWPTSNRSKGSRVQPSLRAWPTRVCSGMSSTINRLSFITVVVNSGLLTESRPTSARNWISRKETGDTPQGRYRSSHGNLASRFDSRTSQIRKWVSRRTVTARLAAVQRGRVQGATPTTTDRPHRHAAPSGVFCIVGNLWLSWCRSALPVAARSAAPCAQPQLPRHEAHHRGDGTSASWLRTLSHFSYVQCTRMSGPRSRWA